MEEPLRGRKSPSRSKPDQSSYEHLASDESKSGHDLKNANTGQGKDKPNRNCRLIIILMIVLIAVIAAVVLSLVLTISTGKIHLTWGHRGDACEDEITNITAYVDRLTNEWEEMVVFKDSDAIVNRYTKDTVFINKVDGRVVQKHFGREELIQAYEEWFASGIVRSEVTPLNEGWFDEDHLYATIEAKSYDENNNVVADVTQVILFKKVGCGFQTHMVVDIIDE